SSSSAPSSCSSSETGQNGPRWSSSCGSENSMPRYDSAAGWLRTNWNQHFRERRSSWFHRWLVKYLVWSSRRACSEDLQSLRLTLEHSSKSSATQESCSALETPRSLRSAWTLCWAIRRGVKTLVTAQPNGSPGLF